MNNRSPILDADTADTRPVHSPHFVIENGQHVAESSDRAHRTEAGDEALRLVDEVSRRIDVLARRLNVLGHFSEDDDSGHRAA